MLGRSGRVPETREWFVSGTRYFAVYRVVDDDLMVLAIVHTSRRWP